MDIATKQRRFAEWLCTHKRDRDPPTQEELARRLRVGASTLSAWKKDVEFLKLWELEYLSTIGSPERKQDLLDTLYKTGKDADDPRHVAAAKTYMDIVEGMRPQQMEVTIRRPVEELSDEEIDAIVAREAAAEQQRRLRLVGNQ